MFDPADGLWYIVSLFLWRIFLNYTPRNIKGNLLQHLCLVFAVSLIAGFIPIGRVISFQRTFAFYPYFVLGFYMKDLYQLLCYIPKYIPVSVFLIYSIIIFSSNLPYISPLLQRTSYDYTNIDVSLLSRCFFYIWTFPISLSIISAFPDVKFFSNEGKYTLFYYMYHMFFVLGFRYLVINTDVNCNLFAVTLYSAFAIFTMWIMRHITFFTFLLTPMSQQKNY